MVKAGDGFSNNKTLKKPRLAGRNDCGSDFCCVDMGSYCHDPHGQAKTHGSCFSTVNGLP